MSITTIVPNSPIVNIDVSAASKVILLPAASTCMGTTFNLRDYKGAASTNNIFLSTYGLDRVDGQSLSSIQLRLTSTLETLKVMSLGNTSWSIIQRNIRIPSVLSSIPIIYIYSITFTGPTSPSFVSIPTYSIDLNWSASGDSSVLSCLVNDIVASTSYSVSKTTRTYSLNKTTSANYRFYITALVGSLSFISNIVSLTVNVFFLPSYIPGMIIQTESYNLTDADGTQLSTWTNNGSSGYVICSGFVNTNVLNSRPVVTIPYTYTWVPVSNLSLSAYSIFFVGRQTGGYNRRVLQDSTTNQLYGYWNGYKRNLYIDNDPTVLAGTYYSNTSWDMFSLTRLVNGSYVYNWDGSLIASGSSGPNILNNPVINQGPYGNYETSDCQIAEIIIYNSVLTAAQVAKVEGYLAWKWDLVANLPSNHLYKTTYPTV